MFGSSLLTFLIELGKKFNRIRHRQKTVRITNLNTGWRKFTLYNATSRYVPVIIKKISCCFLLSDLWLDNLTYLLLLLLLHYHSLTSWPLCEPAPTWWTRTATPNRRPVRRTRRYQRHLRENPEPERKTKNSWSPPPRTRRFALYFSDWCWTC